MGFFAKLFGKSQKNSKDNIDSKNFNKQKISKGLISSYLIPKNLVSYKVIAADNHDDKRVLVHHLNKFSDYTTVKDLPTHPIEELGNVQTAVEKLESLNWIAKFAVDHEAVAKYYTVATLKELLQTHGIDASGAKGVLVDKALNGVPKKDFKFPAKAKSSYKITENGLQQLEEREQDYRASVDNARLSVINNDILGFVAPFQAFDNKWGFARNEEKAVTIFANYHVADERFQYILNYEMRELNNSNEFKNDLRSYIFVSQLSGNNKWYNTADDFYNTHEEKIDCPTILSMYKERDDPEDRVDDENLKFILRSMREKIENNGSKQVLDYYISVVLHKSRIATLQY